MLNILTLTHFERSMGGAIVTHIAEQENVQSMYQGVLAIGAALYAKDANNPLSFNYNPQIPILYLTNQRFT